MRYQKIISYLFDTSFTDDNRMLGGILGYNFSNADVYFSTNKPIVNCIYQENTVIRKSINFITKAVIDEITPGAVNGKDKKFFGTEYAVSKNSITVNERIQAIRNNI